MLSLLTLPIFTRKRPGVFSVLPTLNALLSSSASHAPNASWESTTTVHLRRLPTTCASYTDPRLLRNLDYLAEVPFPLYFVKSLVLTFFFYLSHLSRAISDLGASAYGARRPCEVPVISETPRPPQKQLPSALRRH